MFALPLSPVERLKELSVVEQSINGFRVNLFVFYVYIILYIRRDKISL